MTTAKLDRFEFHDLESVLAVTYDAETDTATCWFGNAALVTTESGGWQADFGTAIGSTDRGEITLDFDWTERPILLDSDIPPHDDYPIDVVAEVARDIARCAATLAPHIEPARARGVTVTAVWEAAGKVFAGEALKLMRIALLHLWIGMNPTWDLEAL